MEAFRKAYPSINLEIVPKFEDQKLLTAVAAKQVPDLLWVDRLAVSSWAARGALSPLDDLVQKDRFDLNRYYESAVREARYQEKLYAVPQFMDVRALYVNLDALKEINVDGSKLDTGNWDQLADYGKQLTKRSGDKVDRWGFDPKLPGFLWIWGWGNGGEFISQDGKKVSYNDAKVVEALDWGTKSFEAQGGYKAYEAVGTTWKADEQFARGQVAMTMYENLMLGIIARIAPTLNFTVMPIKKRGGADPVSFTGGLSWTIPTGAKDPEAAWVFIRFMDDIETWMIGANATKEFRKKSNSPYTPSLTANKEADRLQIEKVYEPIAPQFDAAVKLWPQLMEQSRGRPIALSPVGKQLSDILDENAKAALRGEQPARAALDRANERAQQAIDSFKP